MPLTPVGERRPAQFANLVEVLPGLYRIRTRGSRAYLDVDGDRITLIDVGSRGSLLAVVNALRSLGLTTQDVTAIVVTHAHIDHVGGLPELQAAMPAPVSVHEADADVLATRDPLPNPFQHELLARVSQGLFDRIDPGAVRVDYRLRDGMAVPGGGGVRVIHVPGHTPGSIALHIPRHQAVIVGDALQYRFGRLMLPNRLFTADMDQARQSARKLAALEVDAVCFSHFRPILSGATGELRAFVESLEDAPEGGGR